MDAHQGRYSLSALEHGGNAAGIDAENRMAWLSGATSGRGERAIDGCICERIAYALPIVGTIKGPVRRSTQQPRLIADIRLVLFDARALYPSAGLPFWCKCCAIFMMLAAAKSLQIP